MLFLWDIEYSGKVIFLCHIRVFKLNSLRLMQMLEMLLTDVCCQLSVTL